jgi:hypothetical protein
MALILSDRVQETTATTGTGTVVLAGAVTGYQSFAVVGNNNLTYYTIADQAGPNWEVGIGTYYLSNTSLARTTVLASSNANAAVNFTAGNKSVFVTYPAEKAIYSDNNNLTTITNFASGNVNITGGTISSTNVTVSGLGTMSTQNANSVTITGGTISGTGITSGNVTISGGTIDGTIIGGTTPANATVLNLTAANGVYAKTTFTATYTDGIVVDYATGNGRISVGTADGLTFYNGGVATNNLGGVSANATWSFPGTVNAAATNIVNITEPTTISATGAANTVNFDLTTQSVYYSTANATANWTLNFRGSSTTTLANVLSNANTITCTFMATQGATAYYNSAVTIDGTGTGVTTKWQGGTAPTSGDASAIDVYNYVITKTSTTPTYTVLASVTKFA